MAKRTVSETHIYLDARRILDVIIDVTVNFPKNVKYTIGEKMQTLAMDILQDLAKAYNTKSRADRLTYLCDAQSSYETLQTLVRVAGERQWIKGRGRHALLVDNMIATNRQLAAWKNTVAAQAAAVLSESEG